MSEKHRIKFLLATLIFLACSCSTTLDINSAADIPQEEALQDVDDVNNALQSAYAAVGSRYVLGDQLRAWADVLSDHVVLNPASPHLPGELNLYSRNLLASDSLILKAWEESYKAINRANNIIAVVEANGVPGTAAEQELLQRYRAEAYFIRGLITFELARWFGPQYDPATLALPCIPLRTSATTGRDFTPLSTVQQVYAQAIADLELAAGSPALPFRYAEFTTSFGQATQAAAKAVLAKLYFQMGTAEGDEKCLQLIEELLGPVETEFRNGLNSVPTRTYIVNRVQITTNPLFYPQQFPLLPGNPRFLFGGTGRTAATSQAMLDNQVLYEPIFSVLNSANFRSARTLAQRFSYRPSVPSLTQPRYVPSELFFTNPDYDLGTGTNTIWRFAISQDARSANLFTDQLLFKGQQRNPASKFGYGGIDVTTGENYVPVHYVRSAELMLDRADILARRPSEEDRVKAATEIAYLKGRANILVAAPTFTALTRFNHVNGLDQLARSTDPAEQELLRREVGLERIRELAFEGDRLHNLRRLRLPVPTGETDGSRPGWSVPITSGILPIPEREVLTNPGL